MAVINQKRNRYGVRYLVKYDVLYAIYSAREIYNFVGPFSIDHFGVPLEEQPPRHKKGWNMIERHNSENDFYNKLEQSILDSGIKNPILVNSGKCDPILFKTLPKTIQNTNKRFLVCDFLGGSRLYIAQKHDLHIPCIVSDWTGNFPGELCKSPGDIQSKFSEPVKVSYTTWGVKTTVAKS